MKITHPVRMSEARHLVTFVRMSSEPKIYRRFLLEQHLGAKILKYREYRRYTHKKLIEAWEKSGVTIEERRAEVLEFQKAVAAKAIEREKAKEEKTV